MFTRAFRQQRLYGLAFNLLIPVSLALTGSGQARAEPQSTKTVQSSRSVTSLHHPVPGGVAVIGISEMVSSSGSNSKTTPKATYLGKPVLVIPNESKNWLAIVGIPLTTEPGTQTIEISTQTGNRSISFEVKDKKYREQRLTVKNTQHVNPNEENLARFKVELEAQNAAYRTFSAGLPSNVIFDKPVNGPLSSPFGTKRFFNGEPRAPHSGLDFAVPTGTPVKSPAAGKVILTGDYFFNGLTVFVDHGQGLISMFCHLSEIDVSVGDQLKRGQMLGKVGATGRVTGAHLHWNVSLNDARIDPAIMIGQFNP